MISHSKQLVGALALLQPSAAYQPLGHVPGLGAADTLAARVPNRHPTLSR
jgi:hypothetical protein